MAPGYAFGAGAAQIATAGIAAFVMNLAARITAVETGFGSAVMKKIWDRCETRRSRVRAASCSVRRSTSCRGRRRGPRGGLPGVAAEINQVTNGQWSAKELAASNATSFAGEGGEALVFDAAGNMFVVT
jgi:hypothetical protein